MDRQLQRSVPLVALHLQRLANKIDSLDHVVKDQFRLQQVQYRRLRKNIMRDMAAREYNDLIARAQSLREWLQRVDESDQERADEAYLALRTHRYEPGPLSNHAAKASGQHKGVFRSQRSRRLPVGGSVDHSAATLPRPSSLSSADVLIPPLAPSSGEDQRSCPGAGHHSPIQYRSPYAIQSPAPAPSVPTARNADGVPQFEMSRNTTTVQGLWTEWYEGIEGKPPIKWLEEEYNHLWRQSRKEAQFFSVRNTIIKKVHHLSQQLGSNEAAIHHLDDWMTSERMTSIDKLFRRLKQALPP